MKFIFQVFVFTFLTILTQIGGFIYLMSKRVLKKQKAHFKIKQFLIFSLLYLFSTFLVVPNISPFFGRTKIEDNQNLEAHTFFTKLCNRNYVNKDLQTVLTKISQDLKMEFGNIKLIYLDANFPFFDGFPLLPHLSHSDGKKIDISFIYADNNGNLTNNKISNSGYGFFEKPANNELNQISICKKQGYWQYDFSKYLTFGTKNTKLIFDEYANKKVIEFILKNNAIQKLFIEPHLKTRLKLNNNKIRFQGCRAVRHDDHIHFQIK